jgi:hypothetical protein
MSTETAALTARFVYVTASPDHPPYDYKGRHRRRWGRSKSYLVAALAAVGITLTLACGVGVDSQDAAPLDDSPAATSAAPAAKKAAGIGDGTYEVGKNLKAGKYVTTVPADALNCYWARLKNFDGDPITSINANGNLAPGAKGRITVKASDAGVEFSGGCRWTVAK